MFDSRSLLFITSGPITSMPIRRHTCWQMWVILIQTNTNVLAGVRPKRIDLQVPIRHFQGHRLIWTEIEIWGIPGIHFDWNYRLNSLLGPIWRIWTLRKKYMPVGPLSERLCVGRKTVGSATNNRINLAISLLTLKSAGNSSAGRFHQVIDLSQRHFYHLFPTHHEIRSLSSSVFPLPKNISPELIIVDFFFLCEEGSNLKY